MNVIAGAAEHDPLSLFGRHGNLVASHGLEAINVDA
jgi:hypothetical protein